MKNELNKAHLPKISNGVLLFLCIITLLSFIVKLTPVIQNDFPLNDGGMFYTIIKDIQDSNYILPKFTSYNQDSIPLAYPPLSFYLIASISDITNWPIEEIMRFFPLIFNTLSIPLVFTLAYNLLKNESAALFSALIYSFLPQSFIWLIIGGGISRSTVVFFSLLGTYYLYLLYTQPSKKYLIFTALSFSLALLSHPTAFLALAITTFIFWIFLSKTKQGLINTILLAIVILIVTAPWWGRILTIPGVTPYLAAIGTGEDNYIITIIKLLALTITFEQGTTIFTVLCLFGIIIKIYQREYFLIVWFLGVSLVDPRNALPFSIIGLSFLGGFAINNFVLPGLRDNISPKIQLKPTLESTLKPSWARLLFTLFLIFGTLSSLIAFEEFYSGNQKSLSGKDFHAMEWVSENTDVDSAFLVFGPDLNWARDKTSEWFPALAQRKSLLTVQGSEWISGEYDKRMELYEESRLCAIGGEDCLMDLYEKQKLEFTHIFITKTLIESNEHIYISNNKLIQSLMESSHFTVIYNGSGAMVFEYKRQ